MAGGPTTNLELASACLGISRPTAYRLIDSGTYPVPPRRVGRLWSIPVVPLLEFLGFDHDDAVQAMLTEPAS